MSAKKILRGLSLSGLAFAAGLISLSAFAATIQTFSPQGEIRTVRQVAARFSESMVKFGDKDVPHPFLITCAEPGRGRWIDDRNWVYDFERDLPPGTHCSFKLKPEAKPLAGGNLTGKGEFVFSTGGPAVLSTQPYLESSSIDEDQAFLLHLNGPAYLPSVSEKAYCVAEGVGERIGVDLIEGAPRAALLKALRREKEDNDRLVILKCRQRLPSGAHVTVVWAKGIQTANADANARVAVSRDQPLKYQVRPEFKVSFTCVRDNAQSPCSPYQPLRLEFTGNVTRDIADGIRFKGGGNTYKPTWTKEDTDAIVQGVTFKPPFPETTEFTIELPSKFTDDLGRNAANAGIFPLKTRTGEGTPLVKFSANFGIIERSQAVLPVTLRNVEPEVKALMLKPTAEPRAARVADLTVAEDAAIIGWIARLRQADNNEFESREKSLMQGAPAQQKMLPKPNGAKAFEVIGIPLEKPGFHVVEVQSDVLGAALLGKQKPMYVRASALVTNLAVHLKMGRESGAVWVSTLDGGKPAPGADVRLYDCNAKMVWQGKTDASGVAAMTVGLDMAPHCKNDDFQIWYAAARLGDDMSFALSDWNRGIEPWRFNVSEGGGDSAYAAHTVFDRMLLRANETVSMKHFLRMETQNGLKLPAKGPLPAQVLLTHLGSGQEYTLPVSFNNRGVALTTWKVPADAKLGQYNVTLLWNAKTAKKDPSRGDGGDGEDGDDAGRRVDTGSFRVAEFRLPVMVGSVSGPAASQVRPKEVPLSVQLSYASGGPAAGQEVKMSAVLRKRFVNFPAYEQFTFGVRGGDGGDQDLNGGDASADTSAGNGGDKLVADKNLLKLDPKGVGQYMVKALPAIDQPREVVAEGSYRDPNGEEQTLRASVALWPSAVVAGIKTEGWARVKKKANVTLLAVDTQGKPAADVAMELAGSLKITTSHRRRTVGGFYAYENKDETKSLGTLCSGKTDARGYLHCEVLVDESGEILLSAKAKDGGGNVSEAQASIWVSGGADWWFGGEDMDRMDVLPEKKSYKAGETARFQVRMPFRQATAWVTIEREGVIETRVVPLSGKEPVVEVPIKGEYAPNVFVSVLAVRGRVRDVPWYSFFVWGWKAPVDWWNERQEWVDIYNKGEPTALVDLARPAFKMGLTEISVGNQAFELKVAVSADRPVYQTRDTARVRIEVKTADGKPAPKGTEVAVAAVDSTLLELMPNTSWDALSNILKRRSYYVNTATAQMQVVGRRHFGKKALPPGGGGGRAVTRELFDTLLVWLPSVQVGADGTAMVDVPLNDSLTSFTIAAVADANGNLFGTGQTQIRATKDLQIIPGLPPLVREGDTFRAGITVRNTTARAMKVNAAATTQGLAAQPAPQTVNLAPGAAQEIYWNTMVPDGATRIDWQIEVAEQGVAKPAKDAMKTSQKVVPAVPVTVQQATLTQIDKSFAVQVAAPKDALPGKGGLAIALQAKIGTVPEGVRRYFEEYPFICLEQKTSKSIGLRDRDLWKGVASALPNYLDEDGLAAYFPGSRGSDILTSYVLAVTDEAKFDLPDGARDTMETALAKFVEGKITRDFWAPRKDLDQRKLAAIEALARRGHAKAAMLQSITIQPNIWPTSSVIDWLSILQRMDDIRGRDKLMAEAEQVLRSRLSLQGTKLVFSTENDDYWWWLMVGGDVNAARLIATVADRPGWKEDLPRLVSGLIGRQGRTGAWNTTTANLWAGLALEKFSARFETERVAGTTRAGIDQNGTTDPIQTFAWGTTPGGKLALPWPTAANGAVKIWHEGSGKPWATIQSLAAIPLKAPDFAGYAIEKSISAVQQKTPGTYTRGDILRISLTIKSSADMTWVAVTDPVPGGSTVLGSGLNRESDLAQRGEKTGGNAYPTFEERSFEGYRAYYEYAPKGTWKTEYTVRLNQDGDFSLPPTRVEAMYAPEMFGALPNPRMKVVP
ncbi:MAG TPA: MG2 domain-containing protein [Burkholderiales bacterium]|nr:MG2 domain-containing protein [Burkholderiales bacterium]